MGKVHIKTAAIPRAGYDYQDLAGIEVLIRHYRNHDLFSWVLLEADETDYKSLDDVVAARKDGSYEFVQVKFTVDSDRYELDWDWLLDKKKGGTSLLEKWTRSLARVATKGPIHSAILKTNRKPTLEFAKSLKGTKVDLNLLSQPLLMSVESACGGAAEAKAFFNVFDFLGGLPDLNEYESSLRDQLVPTDTDSLGWLAFRYYVQRWATNKNQPEPDGRILREHIVQLITKRRQHPIRQDFVVPDGYAPPSEAFDKAIRERIATDDNPITILWGTPGRGKSTYLSYLILELQKNGEAVTRHHYFLSAEDSASNRISFIEISTSLIHQLYESHPDAMTSGVEDADKLRSTISIAASKLASTGHRLHIIIDGLDHVWRDTQRVDQLDHLFNDLLPLPSNVCLIVGTQRVPDKQLPKKLLTIAKDTDWIEIPPMDEAAVRHWVVLQDKDRPLILKFVTTPEQRIGMLDDVACALFAASKGHPLYLIYAFETLIHAGRPTSAEDVSLLPPCPDGDIRTYYRGLWVRLSEEAKNTLHILAGSDFFWPRLGIRQVFGSIAEIDFLLESHDVGMVPFHSSIFAWVKEQDDHSDVYKSLLPKVVYWLSNDAPEYWRWGWLWLVQAQSGNCEDLLTGVTRDWVVESLVKGWSIRQIENIISVLESITFESGDFPRTLSLRSLKTRVSNVRDYQSIGFSTYLATSLTISDNQQQALNLLYEIHNLTDGELYELAKVFPQLISSRVLLAFRTEMIRRVNTWTIYRKRKNEFEKLISGIISTTAMAPPDMIEKTAQYLLEKSNYEGMSQLIRSLENRRSINGLQLVKNELSSPNVIDLRRLINDALLRAGSLVGADVKELVHPTTEPLTAFAACSFLWHNRESKLNVHIPMVPDNLIRERPSFDEANDLTSFLYEAFWAMLYVGFCANGNKYSIIYPGLNWSNLGWLHLGLKKLEKIASGIADHLFSPGFSTVYTHTYDIEPIVWRTATQTEYAQYRSFCDALRLIAMDMHYIGNTDPSKIDISGAELRKARKSAHWSDEIWIIRNLDNNIPILDKNGAREIITDEANNLMKKVTQFNDRSDHWTRLAGFAHLYEDERQADFLAHAAECLIGYGWRKDLNVMEVLDSVVELSTIDPELTQKRLETLVPIVEMITEFTDGDETNHVRSELVEVVAKIAPERLPSLYEHYLSIDEYSYADHCLLEFAKVMNLESPEAAALARTFIDDRTLAVLEDRAANEPAARVLLDNQDAFLGRTQKVPSAPQTSEEDLSEREKEAAKIDPTSFGYSDFSAVVKAANAVYYRSRRPFMVAWLKHWKEQGKASQALRSIFALIEESEITHGAEEILDEAFLVSLAIEGKEAAYPWLVKAHILRNGWQRYYTSETEVLERIRLAAFHYKDKWLTYIKDTSMPAPYYRRRGYSFVLGYYYLVHFLMLVGQAELANNITTSLVSTFVEEVREQPIPEAPWFCN